MRAYFRRADPITFARNHAGTAAIIAGLILLFASIAGVAAYVSHQEGKHRAAERNTERAAQAKAQNAVLAGELAAEQIVIGAERRSCIQTSEARAEFLNAGTFIVEGDYKVGADPNQPQSTREVRTREAKGIDREYARIAELLDASLSPKLTWPHWRHAAEHAAFSCAWAFPIPSQVQNVAPGAPQPARTPPPHAPAGAGGTKAP